MMPHTPIFVFWSSLPLGVLAGSVYLPVRSISLWGRGVGEEEEGLSASPPEVHRFVSDATYFGRLGLQGGDCRGSPE